MASNSLPASGTMFTADQKNDAVRVGDVGKTIETFLAPIASLKLTVVLLALSAMLVFLGTVAQWHKDIWVVVNEYFRCWFAWAPLDDCIPPKMWPSRPIPIPEGFWLFNAVWIPLGIWFPGGKTILCFLGANLLAAHGIRFKVQAQGTRLWIGVATIAVGIATTALVILSGSNKTSFYSEATIDSFTILGTFKILLGACWLACVYFAMSLWSDAAKEREEDRGTVYQNAALFAACLVFGVLVLLFNPTRRAVRFWLIALTVKLGVALGYLTMSTDLVLDMSSMRILWQLAKGTFAGLILLGGCYVVFKQRAPVVVLHAGLGLMMANELVVYFLHEESQMHIAEGETATYTQDIRNVELAVISPTGSDEETVTVIPHEILQRSAAKQTVVSDSRLPFDVRVIKFFKNSTVSQRKADQAADNPTTAGIGLQWNAEEVRPGAGTDVGAKVDIASAYVRLQEKQTGRELGTYLVSQMQEFMPVLPQTQKVTVGDKSYDVALRFHRIHKPYTVTLNDVRKNDYIGTDTPRDYSSYVRLADPELNVNSEVRIWMNNPLRFRNETFYQSGYHKDPGSGKEMTTLQVVSNFGWMIPYVGCMIVVVGMVGQFGQTLWRFVRRREEGRLEAPTTKKAAKRASREAANGSWDIGELAVLAVTLLVALASIGYQAQVPAPKAGEMNLYEFGQIPVAFEGRIKPLDTLARNTLRIVSNTETFVDETGTRQPAIKWFLDAVTDREYTKSGDNGKELVVAAEQHQVFKIDNLDVQGLFELQPRQRFRYALAELRGKIDKFNDEVKRVKEKAAKSGDVSLTTYERALADLDLRTRRYTLMQAAFRPIPFDQFPTPEQFEKQPQEAKEKAMAIIQRYQGWSAMLEEMKPPRAIPAASDDAKDKWQIMALAAAQTDFQRQIQGHDLKANPALENLTAIFQAYAAGDAGKFNAEVARYHRSLGDRPPEDYHAFATSFEAFFNHFRPFYLCWMLYLLAFCIAALSWLGWSKPLNRTAFWLIGLTLLVHTGAIVARIYISGRPPVTNLYTTAIFIGWGCVALGMILEAIYKLGIGNFVAAAIGVATLEIADRLAADGDTFVVLQAVLDTQFWLATHVVCINLGYATTILAGSLGLIYVLRGVLTPSLTPEVGKALARMIYGTLCFAIFFSFWGTVLGGLWADDSWGRFWGWDPKENGALMIVLWNAIVLHARWGKLVGDRGLANLCIVGNIFTAWSWFVVNDLGIGLHAYGSTSGTFMKFYFFSLSQLAIVGLGCIPLKNWWSSKANPARA